MRCATRRAIPAANVQASAENKADAMENMAGMTREAGENKADAIDAKKK
ncbi:MAG: hypothetical protein WDN44_13175 [Sphingomonas sp.]